MENYLKFSYPEDPEDRQKMQEFVREHLEKKCHASIRLTPISDDNDGFTAKIDDLEVDEESAVAEWEEEEESASPDSGRAVIVTIS